MQALPGFRDFYPEDAAWRDYLEGRWREVVARYGFAEMGGPILESAELYAKKNESGAEILGQLYRFTDRGERDVALRPEMTPTVARMLIARERQYRKPIKWFSIAPFFRYERQQKGRLREFVQLNCDLVGDASPSADAEILALGIDLFRAFGFGPEHFVVRVSDRRAWVRFLSGRGCPEADIPAALGLIDKLERDDPAAIEGKLKPFGVGLDEVREFIRSGSPEDFAPLLAEISARGLSDFVRVDLSIVRGLAYYTGIVFEIFDRGLSGRALAGGGRYDSLLHALSDGRVSLPAIGLGVGDVTLANFIRETPVASQRAEAFLASRRACLAYVVVADESFRPQALGLVQSLRDAGLAVDFSLGAAKVGRQFQSAEQSGAIFAVVVGSEWPSVKLKHLAGRTEETIGHPALAERLKTAQF